MKTVYQRSRTINKVLPDYISGTLVPKPQDDNRATFTEKLTRNSGYIDPLKLEIGN
jgi:methionyl-tRNA formyltransferase